MYTDQDREMIFVVVSRKEVHLVQNKVREIDPKAFMVVTDAYETFGEGFKQFPDQGHHPGGGIIRQLIIERQIGNQYAAPVTGAR